MFYIDSQRTVTRRESSLITTGRRLIDDRNDFLETLSVAGRPGSTVQLTSDSGENHAIRPKGTVRKEIITLLLESMLDSIVKSWDVLAIAKTEESASLLDKTPSEVGSKRKKTVATRPSKHKSVKSRSKMDMVGEGYQTDLTQIIWWSAPDERSVIHFKNGNIYEGNLSGKCMHGTGRFQWNDGTVYFGEFKENEMNGKGIIQWKDDTWYEGDFVGNLRHGKGLYVDSRKQRSYTGGWHCGTKHGKGTIFYSKSFKNSYDGDWVFNVRHGYGVREYCQMSGYEGEWDRYTREGKGLMVWPNHDFYNGEWKNGVMSGYGMYIWRAAYNNSMSLPSLNAYRGQWVKGQRNGYGILNFGFGLGSHYKGEFKDNKKGGPGKFVTNNGLILKGSQLFTDDYITPRYDENKNEASGARVRELEFNICDSNVGLRYHVEEALKNFDKQEEIRGIIIQEYIENNKYLESDLETSAYDAEDEKNISVSISPRALEDLVDFEIRAFGNAYKSYETQLKDIYYKYATICNTEPIDFTPVLIRLFLWQFYTDCDIHEKGLTLVQIDEMFFKNPDWLNITPHGPFEKIYFWQFLHSMISIASHLYAKRVLPGPKPDTILASGFRHFMDNDVLPNVGRCKGHLAHASFGLFVPLKELYRVYRRLGEPHTVRTFLLAVRLAPHLYMEEPQPDLVDADKDKVPVGRNAYVFADEMTFIPDDRFPDDYGDFDKPENLRLFNFGNLSSKTIINIFGRIFPRKIILDDKILDLDVKITFFEFFEAFITCTEASIRVKEEELRWREMLAATIPEPEPVRPPAKTK